MNSIDTILSSIRGDAAETNHARKTETSGLVVMPDTQAQLIACLSGLASGPMCGCCESRPAVCVGSYEQLPVRPACGTCCGHGNKDGWCQRIADVLEESVALLKANGELLAAAIELKRLARETVNSWACVARTNRDFDYIGQQHRALDAIVLPAPATQREAT